MPVLLKLWWECYASTTDSGRPAVRCQPRFHTSTARAQFSIRQHLEIHDTTSPPQAIPISSPS